MFNVKTCTLKEKKGKQQLRLKSTSPVYCSCMYKCTTPTFWKGSSYRAPWQTTAWGCKHSGKGTTAHLHKWALQNEGSNFQRWGTLKSSLVCSTTRVAQIVFNWGQTCLYCPHFPCPKLRAHFIPLTRTWRIFIFLDAINWLGWTLH